MRHLVPLALALCLACSPEEGADAGTPGPDAAVLDAGAPRDGGGIDASALDAGTFEVTVRPTGIDDVLVNPNAGLADFHFGWVCNLPPVDFTPAECATRAEGSLPENHPRPSVAYFRWSWRDLEPTRGEIDFALIDAALQSANALDETLGFRVMTIEEGGYGIPDWLVSTIEGQDIGGTFWPDYRDATFQAEHQRFVAALGDRYDGHPALDHVDIGTVGCWGEWNTACLSGVGGLIDVYAPADDAERGAIVGAYSSMIDHHVEAFGETPLVMLGIGGEPGGELDVFVHAMEAGTGWRVDCWGDWGWFGPTWSHQDDLYPQMISATTAAFPAFGEVWQHAPIQLEVCGTMPGWHDRGWTADAPGGEVYRSFEWAVAQHAAVLNAKRTAIPADYLPALEDLLRRNGYRYAITELSHHDVVDAGGVLALAVAWTNRGTTPSYTRRTLAYRLRSDTETRVFESAADVRTWLPGDWAQPEAFAIPSDLPAGTYALEVAILDRAGTSPATDPLPPLALAMEGRDADGWYPLSTIDVN